MACSGVYFGFAQHLGYVNRGEGKQGGVPSLE